MRNKNILFLFSARSVFFTQYFLRTISWRNLRRRKKSGHDINYESDQDKFLSFITGIPESIIGDDIKGMSPETRNARYSICL